MELKHIHYGTLNELGILKTGNIVCVIKKK